MVLLLKTMGMEQTTRNREVSKKKGNFTKKQFQILQDEEQLSMNLPDIQWNSIPLIKKIEKTKQWIKQQNWIHWVIKKDMCEILRMPQNIAYLKIPFGKYFKREDYQKIDGIHKQMFEKKPYSKI